MKASGGPYQEQVVINKDLTLKGINDPTIEAPSSPTVFTLPDSGDWAPVVFAFGGSESGGNVSGSGTVDVDITGFTVDGRDRDSNFPVGILLRNIRSQSSISDNTVTRTFVQPRTYGIAVEGDSSLKIQDNDVDGYSRVGIFADGDEGTGPDPDVDVRGNTVTGPGQDDTINWVPNGIQVSSGATGKILNNTVDDHWHPGPQAVGIIIVDSDDVSVKNNSLDENETGIFFGTFFEPPPVRNATIQDNDLVGGDNLQFETGKMDNGVLLRNSHNSKIIKNDFDTWTDGVDIDGANNDNNKVVNNSFTNVDEELDDDPDDNTKNPPNPANP